MMRGSSALTMIAALLFLATGMADEARPLKDNIGHTRHLHRHNAPHPKVAPGDERFVTDRQGAALQLPAEEDAFTFVVFGDRTGGPADGVRVLADAVRDVNLLEPDLVMTVGDLVQGYNTNDLWMRQMREFKVVMDQLLCPWFPVAGNHDVYWRGPKGVTKPAGEHEGNYEMHFGPLWYAFEHKNCWFIALYSDEGDPATGEKAINKPECQRMSPAQFEWLEKTLDRARNADHVFCFLHHPRWLAGRYGDDWNRVHDLLAKAGNVSAVFAGHIHRMHYAKTDGVEYVTLATVGGQQESVVPSAGFLHQYHIVTVRKQQIAIAAVPVGELMDVREITGALQDECVALGKLQPKFEGAAVVTRSGACNDRLSAIVTNPASKRIEVTAALVSADSRWTATPDHSHHVIEPGTAYVFIFDVARMDQSLDPAFRPLELLLDVEYLTEGSRYPLPTRRLSVPLQFDFELPPPTQEHVLQLDGKAAYARIPSETLVVPDGPMTLECWFNARDFGRRTGLVTKTEGSEFGLFVSKGEPTFSIHLDGAYVSPRGPERSLSKNAWHHIAGVYDGVEVRLYVDGRLIDRRAASGKRKINALPLIVGADVAKEGGATSHFHGQLDEVRVSTVARYNAEAFTPARRFESDSATALLLHMDGALGWWAPDASPARCNAELQQGARIVPGAD